MTSGLQNSELIIIAARPSMGKTALAINIAQNCAVKDNKVVAIFSLEMSKESLLRRMLASEANVGSRKLQTGFIPREDRGKLIAALDRLMSSKMFVDDTPGITLAEMRAKARRLRQQEGKLDLIVIDYLQLMTGTKTGSKGFENRTQEVSSISRGVASAAALSAELSPRSSHNRRRSANFSGKSVRMSAKTSPLRPCVRLIRASHTHPVDAVICIHSDAWPRGFWPSYSSSSSSRMSSV